MRRLPVVSTLALASAGLAAGALLVLSRPAILPDANTGLRSPPTMDADPEGQVLLLDPPYDSLDGLTIVRGSYRIRLAGLEGPSRNATCAAADGRLWACGLQARAALHNVIGQGPLECRSREPIVPVTVTSARCSLAGADVGQALVAAGWARPVGDAFREEREEAQRERRGLWDGNWTIRGSL